MSVSNSKLNEWTVIPGFVLHSTIPALRVVISGINLISWDGLLLPVMLTVFHSRLSRNEKDVPDVVPRAVWFSKPQSALENNRVVDRASKGEVNGSLLGPSVMLANLIMMRNRLSEDKLRSSFE
jgi:hypothetical protein